MYIHKTKRPARLPLIGFAAALAIFGQAKADVLEIGPQGQASWTAVVGAPPAVPPRASRTTPTSLAPHFERAAERSEVSAQLLEAVAAVESAFSTNAVSAKGARGVMQLMPATARMLGVNDPYDPGQNIQGGAAYLNSLLKAFDGDTVLAVAAYNAGPGAVRRYGGVPPFAETRAYVDRVLAALAAASDRQP